MDSRNDSFFVKSLYFFFFLLDSGNEDYLEFMSSIKSKLFA